MPARASCFPSFTTETGKFIFLTITNDGVGTTTFGSATTGGADSQLHFTYAHKANAISNHSAIAEPG